MFTAKNKIKKFISTRKINNNFIQFNDDMVTSNIGCGTLLEFHASNKLFMGVDLFPKTENKIFYYETNKNMSPTIFLVTISHIR